jgi:hypothetical protein
MKTTLTWGVTIALALGLGATPASAQLFNNPVYFSPSHGTGFSLHGEYARGFENNGDVNFVGARAMLGLGPMTLQAGAGGVLFSGDLARDNQITYGGAVAINILDLPLVPVSVNLQGGVGYTDFADRALNRLDVPIGVGVAINVPAPILDIEPWAAPRLHIVRESNGATQTEVGFGISAGLNVTLPTGVGVHVAGDWASVDFDGTTVKTITLGAGLHFRIGIPGLVPGGIVK